MLKQEIESRNKAIAIFMGYGVVKWKFQDYTFGYAKLTDIKRFPPSATFDLFYFIEWELNYHLRWDWLMPVVDRIEKLTMLGQDYSIRITIARNRTEIVNVPLYSPKTIRWADYNFDLGYDNHFESKLMGVFKVVSDFCIWYNKQKK